MILDLKIYEQYFISFEEECHIALTLLFMLTKKPPGINYLSTFKNAVIVTPFIHNRYIVMNNDSYDVSAFLNYFNCTMEFLSKDDAEDERKLDQGDCISNFE